MLIEIFPPGFVYFSALSIILNNAKIGKNTIIGAGSLVTQGKEFPEGVLILGNPAKVIRQLTEAEIESIQRSADNYVSLSKKYKKYEDIC